MRLLRRILLAIVAVAAAVIVAWLAVGREESLELVFGPITPTKIDFATLSKKPSPNQYLVCPPDLCAARPDAESPVYEVSATALRDAWRAVALSAPRVTETAADEAAMQYDFVQRSKIMRYPDTISVRFIPLDEERATLAIYSRSHYGRSDFGVNQARIEAWLAALAERLR